jgi:hypothetical protein
MSATVPAKRDRRRRHDRPSPDPPDRPVTDRQSCSVWMPYERLREVARAYEQGDEDAARGELQVLAADAGLLSKSVPLPGFRRRLQIASEKAPTGRMG